MSGVRSYFRRSDVSNTSLAMVLVDFESAKACIAIVLHKLTTSSLSATNAWKAFEEGSKSELEMARKWVVACFARGADANEKPVEDSLRSVDERMHIDEGTPAS